MSKELAKKVSCRYLKTTNTLKSSNFSMQLDTLNAYSYDWWLFCTKVNGKVIFNNTTYSQTTCKHQGKALEVLEYKTDLTLRYTRKSLSNLVDALTDEVAGAKYEITKLLNLIKKPRTHKAKNEERKAEIQRLIKHIDNVRTIKNEVLQ